MPYLSWSRGAREQAGTLSIERREAMRMWRRGIQVLMLTALAGLLVAGAPGLAAHAANGDFKALAEEAIYEATVLVAEYSQTLDATDEAGRERLRQGERGAQRAAN